MREGTVLVTNTLGLHARAAAQLVKAAGRFQSRITLFRSDRNIEANAKSILSVLTLAAAVGTQLTLSADGPDEEMAFEAIARLFEDRFGES
jgi:phosphotransferase system HPr (HPr) family protein